MDDESARTIALTHQQEVIMKAFAMFSAAILAATSANAVTVVDFEELIPYVTTGSPLISGGLQFVNEGAGGGIDAFYPVDWIDGTVALVPNFFGSTTTITLAGGGTFDLISFDFADPFDFADDPIVLTLIFDTIGGEYFYQFTADFLPGYQTVNLSITGINSITLSAAGSFFGENTVALDNIVYDTGVIPEPATWGMMIAGFGLVGFASRRRRTSNRVHA